MAQRLFEFELVEDGVAKSLGRNACAVGDEKNSALVLLLCHDWMCCSKDNG